MLIGSRRMPRELDPAGQVLDRVVLVKPLGVVHAFVSASPHSQTCGRQGTEWACLDALLSLLPLLHDIVSVRVQAFGRTHFRP
mmetsp:Transcript_14076/g.38261  ORF Transcript_14076/g.38261 Transcript_14076/m.38261 type:complete len:83 (+) Transcript_14076:1032-1280(+)